MIITRQFVVLCMTEVVFNTVQNNCKTGSRDVARELNVSNWKAWNFLLKKTTKSCIQALEETDFDLRL